MSIETQTSVEQTLPTIRNIFDAFKVNLAIRNHFTNWLNKQNVGVITEFLKLPISLQIGVYIRYAYEHDIIIAAYRGSYDIVFTGKDELPDWLIHVDSVEEGLQVFHSRHYHKPNDFSQEQNFILAFAETIKILNIILKI